MYDELVKRLKIEAETERYLLPHSDNGTAAILDEAADAIEELQKRVPKTPHGRLIDADALLQEHERIVDSWGLAHIVSAQAIRNASTIIPAEEVKE